MRSDLQWVTPASVWWNVGVSRSFDKVTVTGSLSSHFVIEVTSVCLSNQVRNISYVTQSLCKQLAGQIVTIEYAVHFIHWMTTYQQILKLYKFNTNSTILNKCLHSIAVTLMDTICQTRIIIIITCSTTGSTNVQQYFFQNGCMTIEFICDNS